MTPEQVADYLIGDEVPLDRQAQQALETELGVGLPADLLAFLDIRNGGSTSPTASEKEPLRFRGGPLIEHFYCISDLASDWSVTSIRNYKIMSLRKWLAETGRDATHVPAHWRVFGQNWGGDQWAIDLSVEGGEVVHFDHETLPTEDYNVFPPEDGMRRMGVTFSEFLAGLDISPPFEGPPQSNESPLRGFLRRFLR